MKKFLFTAAFLAACGGAARAEFPSFTIIDSNFVEHVFPSKGLKMTYADGVLTVTSSEVTTEFEINTLQKMFFSASTGITSVDENSMSVVTLYHLDGSVAGTFSSEQTARENADSGIYVIENQGRTRKIVIK